MKGVKCLIFSSFKLSGNETIYVQIENHIKNSIENGLIQNGSKLPSTREVSKLLGISRNSIITAYENLECEGIIKSVKGKGTFVIKECKKNFSEFKIDWNSKINDYGNTCKCLDLLKTELPWEKGMISFKSIAPEEDLFDLEEFKRSFLNICSLEGEKILNYGYARGYKPLIQYLMTYMEKKGVNLKGKEILITNGFTEGFDIVISGLTSEGDYILCEEPTHNTALKIIKAHNLNVLSVPMDVNGIKVKKLDEIMTKNNPKLAYIIPSYHNPTGIVMSGMKRQQVYNICEKHLVPIIEDGFNEELLYSGSHVPPLVALSTNSNGVIYIGSLSKILFPGLRIGWILADKDLIDTLESIKRARTIHTSSIDQGVLYSYMKSGAFERYVKKVKKHYRKKYKFTLEEVKKHIPYEYITGEGGLHIFIKLSDELDAREILDLCYKKGVIFTPGDIFYNDSKKGKSTLRLGFSRLTEEEIKKGIEIIGNAILKLKN